LENEILIIDEVLAVGDAEFQKKCLGKMGDVSKSEGRTVLFVSHNMIAINELCTSGILLENGMVALKSSSKEVVDRYLLKPFALQSEVDLITDPSVRRGNGEARFVEIIINENQPEIDPTEEFSVRFKIKLFKPIEELSFVISVKGQNNESITSVPLTKVEDQLIDLNVIYEYELKIPANTFRSGLFPVYFWIGKKGNNQLENYHYDVIDGMCYFNFVVKKNKDKIGYDPINPGGYVNINYLINKI
jgi:lipopolysaccharide transport system ATP-binding protein